MPSLVKLLSLRLLLVIGLTWACMAVVLGLHARSEIEEGLDNTLVDVSHRLLDLAIHDIHEVEDDDDPGRWARFPHKPLVQSGDRGFKDDYLIYQIIHQDGRVLLRSEDAPERPILPLLKAGFEDTDQWRVYAYSHPVYPFSIQVADSLTHRQIATSESVGFLLLPLGLVLPFAGLLILLTIRRALRPIRKLIQEIEMRSGERLSDIQIPSLPRDLAQIANATNSLLRRLKDALSQERSVAAQMAHELRTPLASALIEVSTAERLAVESASKSALERARRSLEVLSRRSERLLDLTKAEQSATQNREVVHLVGLCQLALEEYCSEGDRSDAFRVVAPETTEEILALGDPDSIAIIVRNLLDNAYRYGRSDKPIELRFQLPATIQVVDFGPGFNPHTPDWSDNGAGRSRSSEGYGLGLTIIARLSKRMGASFDITHTNQTKPHGCTATVKFMPGRTNRQ